MGKNSKGREKSSSHSSKEGLSSGSDNSHLLKMPKGKVSSNVCVESQGNCKHLKDDCAKDEEAFTLTTMLLHKCRGYHDPHTRIYHAMFGFKNITKAVLFHYPVYSIIFNNKKNVCSNSSPNSSPNSTPQSEQPNLLI